MVSSMPTSSPGRPATVMPTTTSVVPAWYPVTIETAAVTTALRVTPNSPARDEHSRRHRLRHRHHDAPRFGVRGGVGMAGLDTAGKGGSAEPRQHVSPRGGCVVLADALQPLQVPKDEVAVRLDGAVFAARVVECEQLPQHQFA